MTGFRAYGGVAALVWGLHCGSAAAAPELPAMPAITAADSVLVVSPHPDDESLCCGGLIHLAHEAGAKVAVVWVTNGDGSRWDVRLTEHELLPGSEAYRKLARQRMSEARMAAASLGVPQDHLFFLGYPDRGVLRLMGDFFDPARPWRSRFTGARDVIYPDAFEPGAPYDGKSLVRNFEAVLERVKPTIVLAPSMLDAHPDHRGTGLLVSRVLGERGQLGMLDYWIVHGGHGWPAGKFDPTLAQTVAPRGAGLRWEVLALPPDAVAAKLRAIDAHRTQLKMMSGTMHRFVRATELYSPALPRR